MKLERRVLIFSCGINPMNGLHICIYKHVNTSVLKSIMQSLVQSNPISSHSSSGLKTKYFNGHADRRLLTSLVTTSELKTLVNKRQEYKLVNRSQDWGQYNKYSNFKATVVVTYSYHNPESLLCHEFFSTYCYFKSCK